MPTKAKQIKKKRTATDKLIYLDNNATTPICPAAVEAFKKWLPCYNPASDSKVAKPARTMLDNAQKYIAKHCNLDMDKYRIIFTSGATESNCFVIRSTVEAYKLLRKRKPHIVISALEHSSILDCCVDLAKCGLIDLGLVQPDLYGRVSPDAVEKAIRVNTALVAVMYVQNEIGCINDVKTIARIAHQHHVPYLCDTTQIFGKFRIDVPSHGIDALSASFHKLYGPKGVGLLILNNDFVNGYRLSPLISGHQQGGLRGGTENPAGVAASIEAMKWVFTNRKQKNIRLLGLRNHLLERLGKHFKWVDYKKDYDINTNRGLELAKDIRLVLLGPKPADKCLYVPNTVLLSVLKLTGEPFCNVKLKHALDRHNIVVGIGSACLTDSPNASHVLTAIKAPAVIKRGTIRISMSDMTTKADIDRFCDVFISLLKN